ncbi:MAG TPA: acetylxylan esterase [Bryobacteraceae bacterium]|nr:acetylxylan esterase [Bryobacteraceae bacterium]
MLCTHGLMSRGTRVLLICLAVTVSLASPPGPNPAAGVYEYLREIALRQLAARREKVAQIRTPEQFEERRAYVRRRLLKMLGPLPSEKTPLHIRKTGTLDRGSYRIEKLIYESRPHFYVTANLYVPQGGRGPYPAVLQPTGHSLSAKARAFYQKLGLGLVQQGFVVLTYDPTGQGERRIFYDARLGDSLVGGTTTEHEMVGIQSLLDGSTIAGDMVWDAVRSIDLLQSLPSVDPNRIGVSGCSGGGTLTAYLAALDPRVKVAAPSCYITDWEDQLLGTGPQDAEQQFPDQLKNGLNHADLVEAFAPKPYLICSTTEDFFPIAGSRNALEESRRIYSLFGAEDKISYSYEPGGHGTTQRQREAIYAWMSRWLKGTNGEVTPEPRFQTEYEEDLLCTPSGQVSTSLGGETPSTLNVSRLSRLTPARRPLNTAQDTSKLAAQLRESILRMTRYEAFGGPLNIRVAGGGSGVTRLSYEASPGRMVQALLVEPKAGMARKQAVLLVDERDKPAGAPPDADVEQLTALGHAVLVVTPSGFGEAGARGASSDTWFRRNKVTWLALMVGKTMVGLHVEDISRGIDVLAARGLLSGGACLVFGKGSSASVDVLHTAVMDARIAGVVVEGGLVSFGAIARTPIHRRIFDAVIPGVLGKYDLPDLVAALAPRPVQLVNLQSPLEKTVSVGDSRGEYSYAEASYRAAGSEAKFSIGLRREEEDLVSAYPMLR